MPARHRFGTSPRETPPFVWTKVAVIRLREMRAAGRTQTEIAAALGGGLTSSAVGGKIYRLRAKSVQV